MEDDRQGRRDPLVRRENPQQCSWNMLGGLWADRRAALPVNRVHGWGMHGGGEERSSFTVSHRVFFES